MMSVKVSIIIVNYNTEAYLRNCITSILANSKGVNFEVIIIDNASVDKLNDLAPFFPSISLKIIYSATNLGFARANNKGLEIARGEYIFFLNPDTILLNDVLDIFTKYMDRADNIKTAICGGSLFTLAGEGQVSYGNFPSVFEAITLLGFLKFYRKYFSIQVSSAVINCLPEIRKVDYICGAAMMVRKKALQEMGSFDPAFFLYFEETELCNRYVNHGYFTVIIPQAKLVHFEGGSQQPKQPFSKNKIRAFEKSRVLYFTKTAGQFTASFIKYIYLLRAILLYLVKREQEYLFTAKIIWSI